MENGLAWKQILATVGLMIVAGIVIGLIFLYSGLYNVAADDETWGALEWVLVTTRENSVEARLDEVEEPPNLDDRELLATGAEHYDAMCAQCHGAPGTEPAELAEGLHPPPPDLVEEGPEESPKKLFWFTKHGIKMTGMPAWGVTHEDRTLWGIVGMMRRFDELSEQEYQTLVEEAAAGHHQHADGHAHGDGGHDPGGEASSDPHEGVEPAGDQPDPGNQQDAGSDDHHGESEESDHDHEH